MIEVRLTDEERHALLKLVLGALQNDDLMLSILRKIEGVDTVVVCERAYWHGDALIEEALTSAARRELLGKLQPRCPSCGDAQVQLVNWFTVPAQWKCRICKHRFMVDESAAKNP